MLYDRPKSRDEILAEHPEYNPEWFHPDGSVNWGVHPLTKDRPEPYRQITVAELHEAVLHLFRAIEHQQAALWELAIHVEDRDDDWEKHHASVDAALREVERALGVDPQERPYIEYDKRT